MNRIKQVTSNGSAYSYDGKGLRVQRTSSGTTTTYVFSGTKVIAEYAGGALSKEYIYAGSQLLATVDASTGSTSYQHPDHLSTRVETGSNAGPTRMFGHYPFGEVWYETGTASKWKFTSYERDSESSLDYAMARHYSNVVGRFMSQDPLAGTPADPQSLNRYAYVRNDPIHNMDPLGLIIKNDPPEPELVAIVIDTGSISFHLPWDDLFNCHGQPRCYGPVARQRNPLEQLEQKQLNAFAACIDKLYGIELRTFVPVAPGSNGYFFGRDPEGTYISVETDVSLPSWRLGFVAGRALPNDNPDQTNYVASDIPSNFDAPGLIQPTQIHELAHSLDMITSENVFGSSEASANKLMDCINSSQ